MKPSWTYAPDWARYLAMDEYGLWTWFEYLPEWLEDFVEEGGGLWHGLGGKEQYFNDAPDNSGVDARHSLESRADD